MSSVLLRIAGNLGLFENFTQLLDMLASAENCENPLLWRYEVTGRNNETFVFTLDQSVDNRQWMLELGQTLWTTAMRRTDENGPGISN